MTRFVSILLFTIVVFVSHYCHAGGNWASAQILELEFNSEGNLQIEFAWISESGLISLNEPKKIVFEFHHWPTETRRWFDQMLPWAPKDDDRYPRKNLADCQNYLLENYKNGLAVNLGQMGTVQFRRKENAKDFGIAPYAEMVERDKERACMLYAAPT